MRNGIQDWTGRNRRAVICTREREELWYRPGPDVCKYLDGEIHPLRLSQVTGAAFAQSTASLLKLGDHLSYVGSDAFVNHERVPCAVTSTRRKAALLGILIHPARPKGRTWIRTRRVLAFTLPFSFI